MTTTKQAVALVDKRPFFEQALTHCVATGILDVRRCSQIITNGVKATVLVATHFGTPRWLA